MLEEGNITMCYLFEYRLNSEKYYKSKERERERDRDRCK